MYLVLFVLFEIFQSAIGLDILIVDQLASPSHQIWNYAIAEELLQRGHKVTMLGPVTIKPIVHKNYTHLVIEDLGEKMLENFDHDALWINSPMENMLFFHDYSYLACKYTFESEGFNTLMTYPKDSFQLILIDLTLSQCLNPVIQKFNYAPTVGLTAYLLPSYLSHDFGNGQYPAYIPHYYVPFTNEMTFSQRLQNYFYSYLDLVMREFYVHRPITQLARGAFGDDTDSFDKLQQHISLLLVNWSPVIQYPQPVTPNIIPIAGCHIKVKPLNNDLKQIMDNAKHGVILFSLGTNMNSKDLPSEKRQAILNAFSRLKETVIWKFESNITDLPKNVIIRNWLPQVDLLAHPKMKLFISHAGGLSTIEASYFGVPLLGLPVFLDQHINIRNLVQKKLARLIDYHTLTEENFYENINEMLTNPFYAKGWKMHSEKFRDQPDLPLQRAMFWIEYVARHNGSHFLDPKSRVLLMFISSGMDILIFITLLVGVVLYACGKALKGTKIPQKEKIN